MDGVKEIWSEMQDERVDQMRQEISNEYGLHLDDDGAEIDDILHERLTDSGDV